MSEKEPLKEKEEATKVNLKDPKTAGATTFLLFGTVPLAMGYGVAKLIYNYGATATYAAKLASIGDGRWGFAAAVVLGRTITAVNILPLPYKNGIMSLDAGNVRANPLIYKGKDEHVMLDSEGVIGQYNRSNRSLHHMCETYGILLAGLYMASTVFPFPTFLLTCLFAVGRVTHSIGYAGGYGKHAPGFLLNMLALNSIEGLLLFVALNA